MRILARLGLLYAARDAKRRLSRTRRPGVSAAVLREVWERVYFGPGDHLWPELIDERTLRHLVRDQPTAPLVTDLVVPELLATTPGVLDPL